jgi:beta-mannanase
MNFKKEDLNSSMLFKMRGKGLCAMFYNNERQTYAFYSKNLIENGSSGAESTIGDYNDDLKVDYNDLPDYDIVAIKKLNSVPQVIHNVLNNIEPKEWDWTENKDLEKQQQLESLINKLQEQLDEAATQLESLKK